MEKYMDKNREWNSLEHLLRSSFGFSEEQSVEQFDYSAKMAEKEEPVKGNYEALKKKVIELEKQNEPEK